MKRLRYQITYGILNWIDATTYLLTLGYAGTNLATDWVFKQGIKKARANIERKKS